MNLHLIAPPILILPPEDGKEQKIVSTQQLFSGANNSGSLLSSCSSESAECRQMIPVKLPRHCEVVSIAHLLPTRLLLCVWLVWRLMSVWSCVCSVSQQRSEAFSLHHSNTNLS